MDERRIDKDEKMTVVTQEETVVLEEIKDILRGQKRGVEVLRLFNHSTLANYSHEAIELALRIGTEEGSIRLGNIATRFYLSGEAQRD